jgi:hypothetical protein
MKRYSQKVVWSDGLRGCSLIDPDQGNRDHGRQSYHLYGNDVFIVDWHVNSKTLDFSDLRPFIISSSLNGMAALFLESGPRVIPSEVWQTHFRPVPYS